MKNILREDVPGAKRPSYSIVYDPEDIVGLFSNLEVKKENNHFYLTGKFKGTTTFHERLLPLDAERLQNGDIQIESIINKYCFFLVMKK